MSRVPARPFPRGFFLLSLTPAELSLQIFGPGQPSGGAQCLPLQPSSWVALADVGVESLNPEEEVGPKKRRLVGYTNPAAVRYQPQKHSKTALIRENVLVAAGLFASSPSRTWLLEDLSKYC